MSADEGLDEDDWEADSDDDLDDPTIDCPNCGAAIYEDADQCPRCLLYVTREEHRQPAHRPWIIITAVLCLAWLGWMIWNGWF